MGEQYTPTLTKTIRASGAVTKRRFVGFDGAQISVAGAKAYGVAQEDIADGKLGVITVLGTAVIEAGGIIAKGDPIAADANGRAVKASDIVVSVDAGATTVTSTAANGDITTVSGGVLPQAINGYALEAASGAGEFIEILLVT
jgi:hypothetical protein